MRKFKEPERCEYCGPGKHTGLPGGACENCMNTGYKYPERAEEYEAQRIAEMARAEIKKFKSGR